MLNLFKFICLSSIISIAQAVHLGNVNFTSAGVIPRVKIGSKYYLLLGKEKYGVKAGTFDSFSGKRDSGEKPWQTAGREFHEESAAALGKLNFYKKLTEKPKAVMGLLKKNSNTDVSGIDYLIDLDKKQYQALVHNFYKNLKNKKLSHHFKEKSQLALFDEDQVKNMIKGNKNRFNFRLKALIVDSKLKTHKSNEQIYSFLPKMLDGYYKNSKNYIQDSKNKNVKFYR
jgi:hypothetical protein